MVILALNNWNIHIMSGRAYIFIFLGGEDVNSNHVHLANQENSRQHCLLEQQFLTTNNLEENSLFMALWFKKNYISKLYPIKFIVKYTSSTLDIHYLIIFPLVEEDLPTNGEFRSVWLKVCWLVVRESQK